MAFFGTRPTFDKRTQDLVKAVQAIEEAHDSWTMATARAIDDLLEDYFTGPLDEASEEIAEIMPSAAKEMKATKLRRVWTVLAITETADVV